MIQALAAEGLPAKGIVAITNGVDCERFVPASSKESAKIQINVLRSDLVLGIVGRMVSLKRHISLLESLAILMPELPGLHLLVLGDHGDAKEAVVQAMRQHPCAERIHWVGMVSDPVPYYQAMDLLVSPSEIEGLSNVVLEAMACATPVLAHNACGNSEVIIHEGNGFCDDLGSVEKLTHSLRRRLEQPAQLEQLGQSARSHVQEHYSLDAMARGYLELYHRIAAAS
jgi:glycosyltransferase involved in cell wall biosynthesis